MNIQKQKPNQMTLKETFLMKDPKMQKALSKILPDSFKEKKKIKKDKDKIFIKK